MESLKGKLLIAKKKYKLSLGSPSELLPTLTKGVNLRKKTLNVTIDWVSEGTKYFKNWNIPLLNTYTSFCDS